MKQGLKTLQRDFINHLKNPKDIAITKYINFSQGKAVASLDAYRANVYGGFESILDSIFEVTKKIIGEKEFSFLCEQYFVEYDSTSGNLASYGKDFPKIIKKFSKKNNLPYLHDLAKLELQYHLCYFAKNAQKDFPLNKFQQLQEKDFYQVKFKLNPSCRFMKSDFSIFEIWQKNLENQNKTFNKLYQKEDFLLVAKLQDAPQIINLSEIEFLFLQLAKKNYTLYQIYEELEKITKQEFDIGKIFGKFINNHVIVGFKI